MKKVVFAILFINLFSGFALTKKSFSNELDGMKSNSSHMVYGVYGSMSASEKIKYRYRKYRGRLQYRRWNLEKKKWLDSNWIDV